MHDHDDSNDLLIVPDTLGTINKPEYLIVHHTGGTDADPLADTSEHTFEIVNEYHRERWNGTTKSSKGFFIGYHYFIEKSGKIIQGRNDTDLGAHTIGYNSKSLGICMAGNFDATFPTKEQEDALTKLLTQKRVEYQITDARIVPHRRFANKTCYGRKLAESYAVNLLPIANLYPPPAVIPQPEPTQPIVPESNWFEAFINKLKKFFNI